MEITELAHSTEFGRHLVLKRDVPASCTVLKQHPFAAVLYDDHVCQRCDFCFALSDKLMRCSRSKFAHYCSVAHQRAAWKAYYKKETEALLSCAPNIPPATVRLAARVLWRRQSEQTQQAQATPVEQRLQQHDQTSGYYSDIEQLESHWDELEDARKVMYAQMAVLTRQYMQGITKHQQQPVEDPDLPDVKHIAQLLARFACNNHTVCDEELRPIGVGIYPLGALINHSCRPNCVQSFEGPSIVFRSVHDLRAGEQVTISYVELAATRQELRRQLLDQYFFDIDAGAAATTAQPVVTASDASAEQQSAISAAKPEPVRIQLQPDLSGWEQEQNSKQRHEHDMQQGSSSFSATGERLEQGGSSNNKTCCLISYASSNGPPWPEDRPDKQLCQMILLPVPQNHLSSSSSSSSSSSAQQLPATVKLPGGMCLFTHVSTAAGPETSEAAAAAGLFADLEGLAQGRLAGMDLNDDSQPIGQSEQPCSSQPAGGGGVLDVAGRGGHTAAYEGQQQPQQVEIVQWGDWGTAASKEGVHMATINLATAAANAMLHIWSLQHQADQLTAQGDAAAAVKVYQQALAIADARSDTTSEASRSASTSCRVLLGPRHILRTRVYAGLLKAAIDTGNMWNLAYELAQKLTPIYELVYPKVWPNLGLHHALVAKLAMYLQQPAQAAKAAAAAGQILQVTHAGSSQILQEIMSIRYEAQQELEAYRRVTS